MNGLSGDSSQITLAILQLLWMQTSAQTWNCKEQWFFPVFALTYSWLLPVSNLSLIFIYFSLPSSFEYFLQPKICFLQSHIGILTLDASVSSVCFCQPLPVDENGLQEDLACWRLGQVFELIPSGQMDFRHPRLGILIMERLSAGIPGWQGSKERLLLYFVHREVPRLQPPVRLL